MHNNFFFHVGSGLTRNASYQSSFSVSEMITIVALILNTIALFFVIWQTILSRKSLSAMKQSMEDSRRTQQIELLPKFTWVIQVQVDLERWRESLLKKKEEIELAVQKRDEVVLQKIADKALRQPSDLKLSKFLHDKMPAWIREIWISGAQYYFDAESPLSFLYRDGKPNFPYAAKWSNERGKESIDAISVLLSYIKDMVPQIILDTPASIDESEFFDNKG